MIGGLVISTIGCDLGTYGRRFEKNKGRMPVKRETPSPPTNQAGAAAPANQSTTPGFGQPIGNPNRNLPAAAVGGGGG